MSENSVYKWSTTLEKNYLKTGLPKDCEDLRLNPRDVYKGYIEGTLKRHDDGVIDIKQCVDYATELMNECPQGI